MSRYNALKGDEKTIFLKVREDIINPPANVDPAKVMSDLLASDVSVELKTALVTQDLRIEPSLFWAYENFSASHIRQVIGVHSIRKATALLLLKNPQFDLKVLSFALTCRSRKTPLRTQTLLVESLPEHLRTPDTFLHLLSICENTKLSRDFLLSEARDMLGLDDTLALYWVERLLIAQARI